MIKLIVFDMDGVLVDARELHYDALNRALESIDNKYVISREEHLSTYDGRPTSKKLQILSDKKGLPESLHEKVWRTKQEKTIDIIKNEMTHDLRMINILKQLKLEGYQICVASNSVRETVKMMLLRKGLIEYVDIFLSNQDVKYPKPNPKPHFDLIIDDKAKRIEEL
tara:strand:+ start:1047 stop:1547 length:501 start_codon:yes stop_codon:yes gene_type:complete